MKRISIAALLAACGTEQSVTGDPFPIGVDLSAGPMLAEVREGDGAAQVALIDLSAPITVLDAEPGVLLRRFADLTLLGRTDTGEQVARAHLQLTVTELHVCPDGAPCQVGAAAAPRTIEAIVGADAFEGGALRVDFAAQELRLFPDIAGEASARGRLCEAVFTRPFAGGGELSPGDSGTRVSFPARRIAVDACLHHDVELEAGLAVDRGADMLFVLSTGIGPTILTESAYERWREAAGGTAPAAADLPEQSVYLPSGPVEGGAGTIDRIALVGGDSEVRGPCRQVYAHHLLSDRNCAIADDCPCSDGTFCRVPAIVELEPPSGAIDVLVVPDDDETLQAYRLELRPGSPEVDGILGTAALAPVSMDVDKPHDRLLVRCESASGCRARPELIHEGLRDLIADCLARADAQDVDAGVPVPDAMP